MSSVADIDLTLKIASRTAREVRGLVKKAADPRTPIEERRVCALAACEQIAATGILEKIDPLVRWFEEHREFLTKGLSTASFFNSLLGRK